ncbi:MAG: hypothetical protein ACTSR3_20340 [Candidatus Helarchaeota archaeon]
MSNKSLLPFVASSLNDVYSKLDDLSIQLKKLEGQINDFIGNLNKQFTETLSKIGKIHDTVEKIDVLKEYKSTTKLFSSTLDQINDSIWYVDFLVALKRILNVVSEIEV